MCGITGFVLSSPGLLNNEHLQKMTDVQAHRGPDAAGYFFSDFCGLGHRRLSILDLSEAANQPFYSSDGKTIIVYNGEVYNFKEIAAKLNVQLRTTSDTEVILEAFLKWGPSMVNELNGMFAIAIYQVDAKRLYLFRDRLGIKPIYTYNSNGIFAFSSELKGILALRPTISLSLNKIAVADYLHLGYVPEPISICNEVSKFPSGTYAVIDGNGIQYTSYWQPEEKIGSEVERDEQRAKTKLIELVNSSVRYRMISDVPFGTFLSGGIDSSLVTAVAQRNSATPVNTFSIGFAESKYNESHYANAVAVHLRTNHHEFLVREAHAIELIDRMIDAYDEPFADSSAIPTMLVSKLARNHVTMTLSGDGGDELFMGYGSYAWAQRMSNPTIRMLRKPIGSLLEKHPSSRIKRISNHFKFEDSAKLRSHIFSQEIYYYSRAEIARLLTSGGSVAYSFDETAYDAALARKLSAREKQALFDVRHYLKDDLLCKVDRATMQFSLETRVPLLDYRIVEFALNLDESLKIRNGTSKYLLKEVLFKYVPEEMFARPKWGFSIPLDRWLQKELSFLVDRYASQQACDTFGLIDYAQLSKYVTAYRNGTTYYYNRIWQIIVLHRLLERIQLKP